MDGGSKERRGSREAGRGGLEERLSGKGGGEREKDRSRQFQSRNVWSGLSSSTEQMKSVWHAPGGGLFSFEMKPRK